MSIFDGWISAAERFWGYFRPGIGTVPADGSWALASIVADVCERAGIPFDRINLDGLEGAVAGLPVSPADPAFNALEALEQIFLFDTSNFDGKIHFVPRGGAAIVDIPLDDLVDDGAEGRKLKRKDSISVPKVLHFEYMDTEGGLSADTQTSDRSIDNRSRGEVKLQTAVIMSADDAAKAAVINHKVSIEEQRGGYEFALPDSYVWLTPGDIVTLDGERLRITEVEIDEGFQKCVTIFDRASAYFSTIQGVPVVPPVDPPTLVVGDTVLHFIDSHILRDGDDRLGYYVAVSGESEAWQGALVELSTDGGENYGQSVDALTDADMGVLLDPLQVHSRFYPDQINRCRVRMLRPNMELESSDLRGMMNRQNLALIGNELINFADADEVEAGVWEIGHLLRGRKGSDIAAHSAGTRFVMLDRSQLWFIDAEVFELGRTLTFRATSFGTSNAQTQSAAFTGRTQIERAPAYLRARRSGGNLIITWQGVGRLGGGSQVRQGQHFTGYRVTINGTAHTTTNQSFIITEPAGAATITVQQVNSITGAGPAAQVTA